MPMDAILNGKTVLVADDTAVTRMVIADTLGTSGVRVLEAESGQRAVQMAADNAVDAFLLDIRMPDMNGIELCRTIRGIDRYQGAPIMFVTAMDQRDVLQWAVDAGCDDFMQKPIDAMVLRKRLGNLIQKAVYLKQVELMGLSLQRYVSPRTEEMARIFATTRLLPGPRQQEVCVLFSDSRGFTELSQELDPELLFRMLSEHLAEQIDLVYNHAGYIDKFAGDGIMAVFDGENMAQRCCRCALDILDMSRDNAARRGSKINRLGIGVHTGFAIVGNLGSQNHLDYTLIGTSVNLATRLCGIANESIVASEAIRDALAKNSEFEFREKRSVAVRGFRNPICVYDLARRRGPGG
jgi:class 3 adenylate cyclase/CheY-like chemotaxis protein